LLLIVCLLPGVAAAEVAETFELQADSPSGITSNTAIDVIAHGKDSTGVWLVTGRGLNYSFDAGLSWYECSVNNGLYSENLSAIYSTGDTLWVAGTHEEMISGSLTSLSDGLEYSDDNGATWTRINFGPDGLDIKYVWGGDRTIYDIDGHYDEGFLDCRSSGDDVDWLFFTAFAGGLLASQDGGQNWRRIFRTQGDSVEFNSPVTPSFHNRYFSCAVDTSHGDSLFLWAGTAGGVKQFVFVPPSQKGNPYLHWVNRVAFCDTCSGDVPSTLFVGGDRGLSIGTLAGRPFSTKFDMNGLGGQEVTALTNIGEYLLVGTIDTVTDVADLVVSTDQGESFTPLHEFTSEGSVADFAVLRDRLYIAGREAGLYVSLDTAQSDLTRVMVRTDDSSAAINAVNAVWAMGDTLLLGTDSGYVELRLDSLGDTLSTFHQYYPEDLNYSSSRITRVKPQYLVDTLGQVDSVAIWTVHHPLGEGGSPIVGRARWVTDSTGTYFDTAHFQVQTVTYDVNFYGDTAFVVGHEGIRFTTFGYNPDRTFHANQYQDTLVIASLDGDTVTTVEVRGDTIVFGSHDGVAISHDAGRTFNIVRGLTDTLQEDLGIRYNYFGSNRGLAGDFIPALGIQYQDPGEPALVWASCRPGEYGGTGLSVAEYRPVTDTLGDTIGTTLVWQNVLPDVYAWNFAFVGNSVFAATNWGLLLHNGERDADTLVSEWQTIPLYDSASGEAMVDPETAVIGVAVVDSFLWVGTDDGTVRIKLDSLGVQQLFARSDLGTAADEVYAFPVPFRPGQGQHLDFHFVVEQAGYVTLEIYDFAMKLVARPIDNIYHAAGAYPDGSHQGISWDGRNGRGDEVAVGVYYFKVEYESGETRWGKLAVIP